MFDLPRRLHAAIDNGAYEIAVRSYADAEPLLKRYGYKVSGSLSMNWWCVERGMEWDFALRQGRGGCYCMEGRASQIVTNINMHRFESRNCGMGSGMEVDIPEIHVFLSMYFWHVHPCEYMY